MKGASSDLLVLSAPNTKKERLNKIEYNRRTINMSFSFFFEVQTLNYET